MHDEVAYPQAERAARTALALDPKLADAWLDQAFVAWWWHGDAPAAFHSFDTALQLEPSSAKGLHWYATALYAHGDYEKSLQTIASARVLDPNNRAIVADEAWLRFGAVTRGRGRDARAPGELIAASRPRITTWRTPTSSWGAMRTFSARRARGGAARQAETIDVLSLAEQRFRSGGRQAMLEQLSASEAERCAHGTRLAGGRRGVPRTRQ